MVSFSVVPGPDRHGVQVMHALRALASRFVVDVLTVRTGDLAYVERFHKTRMLRVPVQDGTLAEQVESFRRALRRQLEGAEYDVVHFRDAWSGLPVVQRARTLGVRTVFELGRSSLGEPRPADVRLAADLSRDEEVCWRDSDLVLVQTELARRFLGSRGRKDRVFVVPPGVDVDRFDWEPSGAGGPPRVLYAGALAPGRGVRVLLRAMRDVIARAPVRLVLAGPIEKGFAEPLSAAVKQLGLGGHVEVLGPIDNEDMPRVLSRATVCVAPAAEDSGERPTACFPTKVLEYMACRRATIAPRRTTVSEVIQDGVDGLLFEPGEPRDLAAQILRLLGDPTLRERIAETAHHRVRQAYPASAARRRLLDAYARLLPASLWNPLGEAAPPILMAGTGSGSSTGAHTDLAMTAGVAPAGLDAGGADDDFAEGGPPTTISAPPAEAVDATGEARTPSPRLLSVPEDTDEVHAGSETEPWIVIAGDGSISKVARRLRGALSAGGEDDGTPSDGLRPPPLLGVSFRAGELDAHSGKTPAPADTSHTPTPTPSRTAPALPPPLEPPLEPSDEVDAADPAFVAAGDLLGPPPALPKVDPVTGE